jgi:hypothetical protein
MDRKTIKKLRRCWYNLTGVWYRRVRLSSASRTNATAQSNIFHFLLRALDSLMIFIGTLYPVKRVTLVPNFCNGLLLMRRWKRIAREPRAKADSTFFASLCFTNISLTKPLCMNKQIITLFIALQSLSLSLLGQNDTCICRLYETYDDYVTNKYECYDAINLHSFFNGNLQLKVYRGNTKFKFIKENFWGAQINFRINDSQRIWQLARFSFYSGSGSFVQTITSNYVVYAVFYYGLNKPVLRFTENLMPATRGRPDYEFFSPQRDMLIQTKNLKANWKKYRDEMRAIKIDPVIKKMFQLRKNRYYTYKSPALE